MVSQSTSVTGDDALRAHARAIHTAAVTRWLRIEAAATVLLAVLDDGSVGEIKTARRDLKAALEAKTGVGR